MAAVTHLVTLVDVNDENSDARQMRVLLLDYRGWTAAALTAHWAGEVS